MSFGNALVTSISNVHMYCNQQTKTEAEFEFLHAFLCGPVFPTDRHNLLFLQVNTNSI